MCKYKFTSKDELELHKVTHKFTHPHECTICDARFTDEGYKEHNDNLTSRHRVSCPLCPERFKNRKQLQRHITIHEIKGSKVYGYRQVLPCNLCQRKFRFSKALLEHQAWHQNSAQHKNEDIPSCSMCCRKFETNKERDRHEAFEHADDCNLIEGDDNDDNAYVCTGK